MPKPGQLPEDGSSHAARTVRAENQSVAATATPATKTAERAANRAGRCATRFRLADPPSKRIVLQPKTAGHEDRLGVATAVHIAYPLANSTELCQIPDMVSVRIPVDALSAEERIELMGRLCDSLDPAAAAPIASALAAELDRREAEADADPTAGSSSPELRFELRSKQGTKPLSSFGA
jgi:putative addiction module component (TIGR02574 family)